MVGIDRRQVKDLRRTGVEIPHPELHIIWILGFAILVFTNVHNMVKIPAEAEAFLAAGEPPVVVSTASWYREARGFFETALNVSVLSYMAS